MQRWTLALTVLVVAMLSVVMYFQRPGPSLNDIQRVMEDATNKVNLTIQNEWRHEMTLINEWTSGGEKVGVHTTQRDGESEQDFKDRHDAMVAKRKTEYPPD